MNQLKALEVERQFFKNESSVSASELFKLATYYFKKAELGCPLKSDEVLSSKKARRQEQPKLKSAFFAVEAFKKGIEDPDELQIIIEILKRYGYTQGHNMRIAQAAQIIMDKTGRGGFRVRKQERGWMAIESGVAVIGDVSSKLEFREYSGEEFVKNMKR
ncbi:MAG: hypothetical protein PHS44_03245 [Candidatus Dojkabacteria bacterium]|nr:hypothetical protein [Candidatus Dojkabacteria bacterium]